MVVNGVYWAMGESNTRDTDPAHPLQSPDTSAPGETVPSPAALFPYAETWVNAEAETRVSSPGNSENQVVVGAALGASGEFSPIPPKPNDVSPHDPIHDLGVTIEPTPTPVPTIQVSAAVYTPIPHSGGVEQWRELVASIFPAFAVDSVLSVMRCESGGNPNATGAAGERGLMQIHPLHRDSTYDPAGNLLAAFRISGGGTSWGAWTCKP